MPRHLWATRGWGGEGMGKRDPQPLLQVHGKEQVGSANRLGIG